MVPYDEKEKAGTPEDAKLFLEFPRENYLLRRTAFLQ
jgi:hypothetical protein